MMFAHAFLLGENILTCIMYMYVGKHLRNSETSRSPVSQLYGV
jgi:hypothetical protein